MALGYLTVRIPKFSSGRALLASVLHRGGEGLTRTADGSEWWSALRLTPQMGWYNSTLEWPNKTCPGLLCQLWAPIWDLRLRMINTGHFMCTKQGLSSKANILQTLTERASGKRQDSARPGGPDCPPGAGQEGSRSAEGLCFFL